MEFSVTIQFELSGIEFYSQLNWNVNPLSHSPRTEIASVEGKLY